VVIFYILVKISKNILNKINVLEKQHYLEYSDLFSHIENKCIMSYCTGRFFFFFSLVLTLKNMKEARQNTFIKDFFLKYIYVLE